MSSPVWGVPGDVKESSGPGSVHGMLEEGTPSTDSVAGLLSVVMCMESSTVFSSNMICIQTHLILMTTDKLDFCYKMPQVN